VGSPLLRDPSSKRSRMLREVFHKPHRIVRRDVARLLTRRIPLLRFPKV
jgi:hypothetical protein